MYTHFPSRLYLVMLTMLSFAACQESASSQNRLKPMNETGAFADYWYAGVAELCSYDLIESRYGEDRKGSAVLIFVTEPFSESKHVKLDQWEDNKDAVTVMKVNFTKKFITGIYPYSMMLSVFTPVQHDQFPHSLKAVMSTQEWCGQMFMQANLTGNRYRVQQYSYFEREGDEQYALKATWLEDELWNMIRVNPSALPVGEVDIIPGFFHVRLRHHPMAIEEAVATKADKGSSWEYKILYEQSNRTLTISFDKEFPFTITHWSETFADADGQTMRTTGTLKKTLRTDYWTKNSNQYEHLRDSLGLSD